MSWGTELWDQFENIALHTNKGLEFCEKYSHFIKERCAIEKEYASKLKKLVKSYQPKKKEEDEYVFTITKSFLKMTNEVNDMAGQHETIAENLLVNIVEQVANLVQEMKSERKKYLQEGAKNMNNLSTQISQLERSKKQYEKAFKEAEKATEAYKKADADINLSRAEVEKAKNTSLSKNQQCEDCKNEYAAELQKTNDAQKVHYTSSMPATFQDLQNMEEKRIQRLQECIRLSAEIERQVLPIINSCIEGIMEAAGEVNPQLDSKIVIDRYKSGLQPPGDIIFEDLSQTGGIPLENSTPVTPSNIGKRDTLKGTVSTSKSKKRGGILGLFSHTKSDDTKEDYSHLPPNQQKRKLAAKIDSLRVLVGKETAERDGLIRMKEVYEKNRSLGDPQSLEKQLKENGVKLDKLQQELQKFEGYLAEASGQTSFDKQGSDESLTKSMTDMSVTSSQPNTPKPIHLSRDQPQEQGNDYQDHRESFNDPDSFDDGVDDFPVIGTARALYPFEAVNEGSISMDENEEMEILEQDQGDGWTRVRKKESGEEGFVPTTYIEVHFES